MQWIIISLSGVMAPGPATAATLAIGTHRQHAGLWIAVGHAIVELPLIVLVVLGAQMFQAPWFRIGVGLAGGAILLIMAAMLIQDIRQPGHASHDQYKAKSPIWTGVVVTGANPYFLLWWATVGLAIATQAAGLGILAFVLFVVVHWVCDLIWLEALSNASHKGVDLLGGRAQSALLSCCAIGMAFFGLWFIYDSARSL